MGGMIVIGFVIIAGYTLVYLSWTRWPKRNSPPRGYARGTIFGAKFGILVGAALVLIGIIGTIVKWLRG